MAFAKLEAPVHGSVAAPSTGGWLSAFLGLFSFSRSGFSAEEADAIAELRSMSDRELSDMGIGRGEIPHAVRYGLDRAYNETTVL